MKNTTNTVRTICEIGIFAALGFVFDELQGAIFAGVFPSGGSIGFAMIAVLIIAYRRGLIPALLTGFVMGAFDLLTKAYVIHPMQVMLDYIFPYMLVGLAGLFKPLFDKATTKGNKILWLLAGTLVGGLLKFTSHYLAGIFFWSNPAYFEWGLNDIGLVIFLTAVTVGFLPIGFEIGRELATRPHALVAAGFIIGMVVVLAEPAVHVLNKQVEEVTGGLVTKRSMLIALSVGVGISIGLSMLRIIIGFPIIYYLLPGYFISLGLSFFVPKLYTAIAFDSGGVASGPLTSSFILPLAIGACSVIHDGGDSILNYAFGIVAMVAMTPLITIQILGFKAIVARLWRNRMMMRRLQDADDEQIIDFV